MNISAINSSTPVNLFAGRKGGLRRRFLPASKPDTFEKTKNEDVFTEKTSNIFLAKKYEECVKGLKALNSKAQRTFEQQNQFDGWSAKLGEKISGLWGSKNRSELVKDDINQSKFEIEQLEEAASEGNFQSKFYEIFKVGYNKDAIDKFSQFAEKYTLIQSSEQIAEFTEEHLRGHIDFFEEHKNSINPESPDFDKTKKHPDINKRLSEYKSELSKMVGGDDNLKSLAEKKMQGFITASKEQEIDVYNQIAEDLIYTTQNNYEQLKEGKKDKELEKEYNRLYEKAFGKTNNIQKRVNKYVLAQQIRSVAVKDMAIAGIVGASIALTKTQLPNLTGSIVTTAGYFGMDLADLATNGIDNREDLTKESIKNLAKNSLLYGAEYFVGSKLYDIIPTPSTENKILNRTLNVTRTLGIELSSAFVCEYIETGKWGTDQITPQSLIALTLATFAAEELTRLGLSSPSGLKSEYHPEKMLLSEQTVETVSRRATAELQKQYAKNPVAVMNLKLLNLENPELFNQLMAATIRGNFS